jgi:hypothetical protein
MDFSTGPYHVACHRRILGWHLPGGEPLFFGLLRIRYEIRYQGAYHSCQYPELWRQCWTCIARDQIQAVVTT